MEIVWALLLFAAAVVLNIVLLVRDARHRRALQGAREVIDKVLVAHKAANETTAQALAGFQATVAQYQVTMDQVAGQLKAAGLGIESRDHIIQQQATALHDINNVIHSLYTLFTSDEDRELLNDAWRAWHVRNHNNLTGIVL